eukprot:g14268.t1
MPIMDGYMMEAQVQRAPHLGGFAQTKRLAQYLLTTQGENKYPTELHATVMATAIKDRLAVCPLSKEIYGDELQVMDTVEGFLGGQDPEDMDQADDSVQEEKAFLQKEEANALSLQTRLLKCGEVLFQPKLILEDADDSLTSVTQMVLNVVNKCDVDTRRELLSHIFLSGKVTNMNGFQQRFTNELKAEIPHASSQVRVYGELREHAVWTGGSVLASLDDFQDSWVWNDAP